MKEDQLESILGMSPDDVRLVRILNDRNPRFFDRLAAAMDDQQDIAAAWVNANRFLRTQSPFQFDRHLDRSDLNHAFTPNCGHKWIDAAELPHALRRNSFARPDSGWKDTLEVIVRFDLFGFISIGVTETEFLEAFRSAMSTWNSIGLGVQFRESSSLFPHIVVRWTSTFGDEHGVLNSTTIAHADFPLPNSEHVDAVPIPICFAGDLFWSVDPMNSTAYDIETVALHELGHCLGLQHKRAGSIMYSTISKGANRTVDDATASQARALYA